MVLETQNLGIDVANWTIGERAIKRQLIYL